MFIIAFLNYCGNSGAPKRSPHETLFLEATQKPEQRSLGHTYGLVPSAPQRCAAAPAAWITISAVLSSYQNAFESKLSCASSFDEILRF